MPLREHAGMQSGVAMRTDRPTDRQAAGPWCDVHQSTSSPAAREGALRHVVALAGAPLGVGLRIDLVVVEGTLPPGTRLGADVSVDTTQQTL